MTRFFQRLLVVGLGSMASFPALAQTDNVAVAHQAAANQLGLIEYCRGRGDVDDAALEAERSSIARLPPSNVDTTAAESSGKSGTMSMAGTTTTLAAMASSRNVPIATICKQMGDAAVQTAAAFKNNGGYGAGMTAMPSYGTMPGMPPGMPAMPQGMPSMPSGMPAMPPGMPAIPGMPPAR